MALISARRSVTGVTFAFVALLTMSAVSASAAAPQGSGKLGGTATTPAAPPVTSTPPLGSDPGDGCQIPVDPTPIGMNIPVDPIPDHGCRIPVDPPPIHPCPMSIEEPTTTGAAGAGASVAPGEPNGPDDPVCGPIPVDPGPFPGNDAYWVTPTPGLVDVHAVAFDHISVAPDGVTLSVFWWGGTRTCYGLDSVKVTQDANGTLVITLYVGTLPGLEDVACIDIAEFLATDITLDHPLFTDGSGN